MSTAKEDLPQAPYLSSHFLSLLIVDDDPWIRDSCKEVAEEMGFRVGTARSAVAAIQELELHSFDVVVLDIESPGPDGLDLLLKIKRRHPQTEVIAITEQASGDSTFSATRTGAYYYLHKPFAAEDLKLVLERVTEQLRVAANPAAGEPFKNHSGYGGLVGHSTEMEKLYRIIAKVASSRHPVLIQGENGSGKEMVARAIHFTGSFRDRPFVSVDCDALAPSLLESELFGYAKGAFPGAVRAKEGLLSIANGGTIFLDEIAEMPLELQSKLLRSLQEREIHPAGSPRALAIDVRIIAATTRDLEIATHQGSFRRELYARLNVVSLRLPALRERTEDIRLLVDHFLERLSRANGIHYSISTEAMKQLLAYDWPGNVRELESSLERACAVSSGPLVNLYDLPSHVQQLNPQVVSIARGNRPAIVPLAEIEKQAIIAALQHFRGDKLTTAKMLGIGKTTLYRKLKQYGITDRWTISTPADDSKTGRQAG